MRKASTAALIVGLIAALINPISAQAGTTGSTKGLDYAIMSDGTVTILRCTGWVDNSSYACPNSDYKIPASIGGKPVTAIADRAFYNSGYSMITLPASILTIGKRAFASKWAQSVPTTLPPKIQRIDDEAFGMCSDANWCRKLVPVVTVPASVTYLGHMSLPMAREVKFLGNAPQISTDDIFNTIKDDIFDNPVAPLRISALAAKSGWESRIFARLPVVLDTDPPNPVDGSIAGLDWELRNDDTIEIMSCAGYKHVSRMLGGENLCPQKRYVVPETISGKPVRSIDASAFDDGGLTSITFPNNLENIGIDAFRMNNIKSVTLPPNLKTIGSGAFFRMFDRGQVQSMVIPASVTSIGAQALPWLERLEFLGNAPTFGLPRAYESSYSHLAPLDIPHIFADASKTGWASHVWSGQHVVLNTDPVPAAAKVEWKLWRENNFSNQLSVRIEKVNGVTFRLETKGPGDNFDEMECTDQVDIPVFPESSNYVYCHGPVEKGRKKRFTVISIQDYVDGPGVTKNVNGLAF